MTDHATEIDNRLGTLRQKRGFSAAQLAKLVGVSRQTIYAIEAGSYVPNTALALKLARVLESRVEELFSLSEDLPAPELRTEQVMMLPGAAPAQSGQPVQLCRVDRRILAAPPSPVAWYCMHSWLQDYAYRINIGWWVFVAAALTGLMIAFLAVSFQSIKAALASTVKSLRME